MEGNGAYAISKHALVAFSDTLRQEMKKWGVNVSVIEPTGFSTGKYLHFQEYLSVIKLHINFVRYSPIHFINDTDYTLWVANRVCMIIQTKNIHIVFNEQLGKTVSKYQGINL